MSGPACPDRPVLMDGFAWYDKLVMRAGLVALPQYWLWGNWALLAALGMGLGWRRRNRVLV